MKCPKCNYLISESAHRCTRCGATLTPVVSSAPSSQTPSNPAGAVPRDAEDGIPAWRKEVTRKVKAYEQKKKYLTTPPGPIKETTVDPEPTPEKTPAPERETSAVVRPSAPPGAKRTVVSSIPPSREEPVTEIYADDIGPFDFEQELAATPTPVVPLYLTRRTGAFLVDNTILIVLQWILLFFCGQIIGFELSTLLGSAWMPLGLVFLLFHSIYYVYFYKTSRQTPGQVFFGIELRDPLSGSIPLSKIVIRWMAMMVFNVFNFLPLLAGRKELLLDRLSGTEIRRLS